MISFTLRLRTHPNVSLLLLSLLLATTSESHASDYTPIIPTIQSTVRAEMQEWNIGGIAIALVDDQRVVHAEGFGEANRDSLFRAGSISKLFNAIAVMQKVEDGKLDLDAPIRQNFLPVNPFPEQSPVTLRQLLCHKSGLQRETPVGGYLDGSQPTLDQTVASLNGCVLVTKPGEKTRYSNIGPSLAGFLVKQVAASSYEAYQQKHILKPLGMKASAWTLKEAGPVIVSHMRVTDGKGGWTRRDAPLFDLGTIPAGNLFTTVDDLAKFASALMRKNNGLVESKTLEQMWTPQFTENAVGFGLGFFVGKFREHKSIGHNGAVYGHSTSFILLPEAKLSVIVFGNEDIANGRIRHISNTALSLMLLAKLNETPPKPATYQPKTLRPFSGHYESQSYWAHLEVKDGKLVGDLSGQPTRFTPTGELEFKANSRINTDTTTKFQRDKDGNINGFTMGSQVYKRAPKNPQPLPKHWRKCLGSYGSDFIPLVITERHGHLYVMTENMVDYRMVPINRNSCSLPPGMYINEQAIFLTNPDGTIHGIDFANMIFKKVK